MSGLGANGWILGLTSEESKERDKCQYLKNHKQRKWKKGRCGSQIEQWYTNTFLRFDVIYIFIPVIVILSYGYCYYWKFYYYHHYLLFIRNLQGASL